MTPLAAQETVKFDPGTLGSTVSGAALTIDRALLGEAANLETGFELILPTSANDWVTFMDKKPASGLIKFGFTLPTGEFIEALSFAAAQVPPGTTSSRLEKFGAVIARELVPNLLAVDPNAAQPRIRRITIGKLEGIELFGSYEHPVEGEVLWRYVGLLKPFSRDALIALAQVNRNRVAISGPDALGRTLSGRTLSSVTFGN